MSEGAAAAATTRAASRKTDFFPLGFEICAPRQRLYFFSGCKNYTFRLTMRGKKKEETKQKWWLWWGGGQLWAVVGVLFFSLLFFFSLVFFSLVFFSLSPPTLFSLSLSLSLSSLSRIGFAR